MIEIKQPKLFGKDEDGIYLGRIEEIATSDGFDVLYICNRRPNAWILSPFTGYRQIGKTLVIDSEFKEGDLVKVTKKDGKIVHVEKDGDIK